MKGIRLSGAPLYLDMQATTPLDPRVLDAMLPYMTELYGNPHSRTHMYGWESEDAVETARKQVRNLPRAEAGRACSWSLSAGYRCACACGGSGSAVTGHCSSNDCCSVIKLTASYKQERPSSSRGGFVGSACAEQSG